MAQFQTIWHLVVASMVIWRLSRALLEVEGSGRTSHLVPAKSENILGSRVLDCLYWLSVWLSAQTAVWVMCGLTGVVANWLLISGVLRVLKRDAQDDGLAEGGIPCV
jgi:hypothetical protein